MSAEDPRPSPAAGSGRRLTVLVAPDSFKGSLTSVEVARAIAAGWRRARPADAILLAPLADGGEGTLAAIEAAGGWHRRSAEVTGPRSGRIVADWLRSDDGTRATLEMARASGLSLVAADERATRLTTSFGTGELIRAALDAGVRHVTLGIGGSATTDGGSGILEALGARPTGRDGGPLPDAPIGPNRLGDVAGVDLSGLDPRLAELDLEVASDVTNPLLGTSGAAAVYGPQKGATPDDVAFLDGALATWADALEAATGRRERGTPGAGAAGGVGFALLCLHDRLRSFALRPGVDLVMEATGFDASLGRADVVLTGEGRIDAQTAFGKTALGVARRARRAAVPCVAIGGGIEPDGEAALAGQGAIAIPSTERPISLADAIAQGAGPIERCAERVAAIVGVGLSLAPGSARRSMT